jgi:putative transposase
VGNAACRSAFRPTAEASAGNGVGLKADLQGPSQPLTLSEQYPVAELCKAFGVCRSSYYCQIESRERVDPERERLKARVVALHEASRGAAGARTLSVALKAEGESVGRYKAGRLMMEVGIESKQPHGHRYKKTGGEAPATPNHLNREFTTSAPNQVWCSDITYIWAGTCWVYVAVVLDLYARRVVGWAVSRSPDTVLPIHTPPNA